jgi:hypothetical protein
MPSSHPHSLYSAPLSWLVIWPRVLPRVGLSLVRVIACRDSFSKVLQNTDAVPNDKSWPTFESATLEVEKVADIDAARPDVWATPWLFSPLVKDQEFEQFLAGISGLYRSKRVEDPAQALRVLNTNSLHRAIISFIDRSFSSDLVSGITEQRRTRVALKVIETDASAPPHILSRTLCRRLSWGTRTPRGWAGHRRRCGHVLSRTAPTRVLRALESTRDRLYAGPAPGPSRENESLRAIRDEQV